MQDEKQPIQYKLRMGGGGALNKSFDPRSLIVKMCTKYFHNSANTLSDEDIGKLLNSPKVRVDFFRGNGKLMNLSMEFNRTNKNSKVYFSSNIEYYASVIDDAVQLFAVTYTKRQGVNSVAISYLPQGKVEDAIFLARVCHHPSEHRNKLDSSIIPAEQVHIHKASERFYRLVQEREKGKPLTTLAKHYADPDAVPYDSKESVNVIAKKMFKLNHKSIDIYKGKDMIDYMKKNVEKALEKK